MALDSLVESVTTYRLRPTWQHLYAGPFAVLYLAVFGIWTSWGFDEHYELGCIGFAAVGLLQVSILLFFDRLQTYQYVSRFCVISEFTLSQAQTPHAICNILNFEHYLLFKRCIRLILAYKRSIVLCFYIFARFQALCVLFGHWFVGVQAFMTCSYVGLFILFFLRREYLLDENWLKACLGIRPQEGKLGKSCARTEQWLEWTLTSQIFKGYLYFLNILHTKVLLCIWFNPIHFYPIVITKYSA